MAKKTETTEKLEREYVIPLRERCRPVPKYKKTPKAIKTIKEFLVRHMKIRDRDLNKIKLDRYVNEFIWNRGIKNPPHKIKIRAIKEGEIVKVELAEMPKKFSDKKKRETKSEEISKSKKKKEVVKEEVKEEKTESEIKEEKEKKASSIEETRNIEKSKAKEMKHLVKENAKQPKHQFRQALQK